MTKNLFLYLLCFSFLWTKANDTTYVNRQEAYVNSALQNNNGNKLTLQAYEGVPIDSLDLDAILSDLTTKFNPDFQIVELVRILFYSNNLYASEILPVLDQIPFWINKDDTVRNFWTENHMIMWMSSEWLLHERYNIPVDSTLYPRLVHYLKLKLEYGFYEFYSSVYSPYTLSGLLNLYEFTEDPVLKDLSMQVAQRLLINMLQATTDQGVFFPASSRSYPEKYNRAYAQNHNSLIYLLTGFGEIPTRASHAGAFLATSSLPIDLVVDSWSSNLDTLITNGHSLANSFAIHDSLTPRDRLIFQWSSSAYAHPTIIEESFNLLIDSNLWEHKDWASLKPLSFLTPESAPTISEQLSVLSYSSVISEHQIRIFKNKAIALMSIADLWKGKIGFQQWPLSATIGTTAVYLLSGKVNLDWGDRDRTIENSHLPHVEQKSNLALVMYRPEVIPEVLNAFAGEMIEDREVGLFWENDEFDKVVEDGFWLLGRQAENYIAVRRSCTEKINSWWACATGQGQTWVVIVGDSSLYGDFSNFQNSIAQSQYTEEWYYNDNTSEYVYYAQIIVDTDTLEYAWGDDNINSTAKLNSSDNFNFSIYPNPSKDFINIKANILNNQSLKVSAINTLGELVYSKEVAFAPTVNSILPTAEWQSGIYTIVIEKNGEKYYERLVKL